MNRHPELVEGSRFRRNRIFRLLQSLDFPTAFGVRDSDRAQLVSGLYLASEKLRMIDGWDCLSL